MVLLSGLGLLGDATLKKRAVGPTSPNGSILYSDWIQGGVEKGLVCGLSLTFLGEH